MKIVIEIPEEDYESMKWTSVKNGVTNSYKYLRELILNGTPLENILDKLDKTIVDALDNSENQVECQTLRWVLDVISEVTKYGNSN